MQRAPVLLRTRRRRLLLYWCVQGVAGYFFAMPVLWALTGGGESVNDWLFYLAPFALALLFVGLQVTFLFPIRRPQVGTRGLPVLASLVIGGLLCGLLALAGVMAIGTTLALFNRLGMSNEAMWLTLLVTLGGVWLLSTPLLFAFCRKGPREKMLERISAGLFLGSMVEAAAIIPLDALVRRREDCICATGTYLAMAICGAVGVFVFGPAVFLPLLARHRKRWYGRRCEVCGYDMSGAYGSDRCPECGAGWRAA